MWIRRNQHTDTLTGDSITRQERLSLLAQQAIRQWKFVIAFTGLTVAWWIRPSWFHDKPGDPHWEAMASYLAILVEAVIGIGMFGWATRDSRVLRRVAALEKEADESRDVTTPLLQAIAQKLGVPTDGT